MQKTKKIFDPRGRSGGLARLNEIIDLHKYGVFPPQRAPSQDFLALPIHMQFSLWERTTEGTEMNEGDMETVSGCRRGTRGEHGPFRMKSISRGGNDFEEEVLVKESCGVEEDRRTKDCSRKLAPPQVY